MKLSALIWVCLCYLIFLTNCTSTEQHPDEGSKGKDRNMFGLHIPRGLTKTSEGLTDGYVMFCVFNSSSTYLVNRKGQVVHEWKGNYPVEGAYLNNDGSLFQNVLDPDFPVFAGGGESGRIQKIRADGKILWDYEYSNEEYCNHHDIAVMPNGNVLAIAWEAKTAKECLSMGRKSELTPEDGLWPDKIVEIKPDGQRGGEIVWEWHIWDHLIQDTDPSFPNYGTISDHPELLDINKGRKTPPRITQDSMDVLVAKGGQWRNRTAANRGSDVYHVNAINYNADLDQIVFSSPALNEILIIDHSTTTAEAASHAGGRYGKGGDLLYRWGNPQNYNRGDSTDQKLFGQHDIRWVEKGKPGAGNLTVFNNDIPGGPDSMEYSAVYEISPTLDAANNYVLEENMPYGPESPLWKYMSDDTISFHSAFISGAHRMENGNTFINEGARGRFFEVTPDREIVWEYLSQYHGNVHKPNGDPIPPAPFAYIEFRSTFIPADHPGLSSIDLEPIDPQPPVFVLPKKKEKS